MLASLFGGRVRAETLEALAGTSRPLSAYRLAKLANAEPIQVLSILKSLPPTVVQRTPEGWLLVSRQLRQFFREDSSRREEERRAEKDELLMRLGMRSRPTHGRR